MRSLPTGESRESGIVRSPVHSNERLLESFETFLIAMNRAAATRQKYLASARLFVEMLGSKSAAEMERADIRRFQTRILADGASSLSVYTRTAAIRAFSKFLRLAGVTSRDNALLLSQRRLPSRVPRVLTIVEIERLVAACATPFERAIVEVLYATGVRISELVGLRIEDLAFSDPGVARVKRGKGGKDRIVLFGRKAAAAIEEHLGGRTEGFLFEVPAGDGFPARPYCTKMITLRLRSLAFRARVAGVHPHALRRAFATHMIENGADLRAVQELLGHQNLTTTMLYTNLSVSSVFAAHARFHPHAERGGAENGEES